MSAPSFAGSPRCALTLTKKVAVPAAILFRSISMAAARISASGAPTNVAFPPSPIHLVTASYNDWLSHKYSNSSSISVSRSDRKNAANSGRFELEPSSSRPTLHCCFFFFLLKLLYPAPILPCLSELSIYFQKESLHTSVNDMTWARISFTPWIAFLFCHWRSCTPGFPRATTEQCLTKVRIKPDWVKPQISFSFDSSYSYMTCCEVVTVLPLPFHFFFPPRLLPAASFPCHSALRHINSFLCIHIHTQFEPTSIAKVERRKILSLTWWTCFP